MGDVVDMQDYQPHLQGPAKCIKCEHEWRGVCPVGVVSGLECPECGCMTGCITAEVIPNEAWECNCGCDAFWLIAAGPMCRNCGVISTDWFEGMNQ